MAIIESLPHLLEDQLAIRKVGHSRNRTMVSPTFAGGRNDCVSQRSTSAVGALRAISGLGAFASHLGEADIRSQEPQDPRTNLIQVSVLTTQTALPNHENTPSKIYEFFDIAPIPIDVILKLS